MPGVSRFSRRLQQKILYTGGFFAFFHTAQRDYSVSTIAVFNAGSILIGYRVSRPKGSDIDRSLGIPALPEIIRKISANSVSCLIGKGRPWIGGKSLRHYFLLGGLFRNPSVTTRKPADQTSADRVGGPKL